MTAPTVVQSAALYSSAGSATAQPVFGSSVTAGNLLVAMVVLAQNDLGFTPPFASPANGWTLVDHSPSVTTNDTYLEIYTRTALVGDGTTPPLIATGGYTNATNSVFMWEIANPGALDVSVVNSKVPSTGGSTSSLTSANASELALCACATFFGSARPTITGTGWTSDTNLTGGQYLGSMAHLAVPTSGTSVSATIGASSNVTSAYGLILFGKATVVTETGTITQSLPAPTQSASGFVAQEGGTITQALPAPTQAGALFKPGAAGTGLRQFSTFGG